jgi:2-succinyl-6-hydroxy-2,4-cyclohexadiene-1-carboxylate synthase
MIALLHGFTGHPSNWDPIARRIDAHRTHAYALLGHSPECPAGTTTTWNAEVDRVASLIRDDARRLYDEKVCLVGYSMGGRVALSLLVRHPSLFASAILVGASPGLVTDREREDRIVSDERWIEMLRTATGGFDRFLDAWQDQPIFDSQRQLRGDTLHEQRKQRSLHDPAGLIAAMNVLGLGRMPNLWPDLGKIEVPVQLVVGARDTKFREIGERMAFPVHVVDGVGHNVVLEDPTAMTRLIANVCEKTC